MATFLYKGIDQSGRSTRGELVADSPRAARDRLRSLGVQPQTIREQTVKPPSVLMRRWQLQRFKGPLTELIREMATLLQASVPLLEALQYCQPHCHRRLRPAVSSLVDRVATGQSLADAMLVDQWLYGDMLVGMVRVGEAAGNLDEVLSQIADFYEQERNLKNRFLSAVIYPCIVFFASIAITLFLMTVVVPMLLENLAEMGRQLPWPTRVLKFCSDLILNHGPYILLTNAAIGGALAYWASTQRGQIVLAKLALRIPLLGRLMQRQSVGRVCIVVACLLRSGIELVEALEIAADSGGNPLLRGALQRVTADLERGEALRESIAKHPVFPPAVAQVFALGQQSGKLESMLDRLGHDYDKQSAILAGRIASVAEPVLILVLSVIVGFILFATVLPILNAGNVLAQ